jgi:lipopolysaccharide/colanic/teichoic acid biosynthesis glycosyltransferase
LVNDPGTRPGAPPPGRTEERVPGVVPAPATGFYLRFGKRWFDIAASGLGMILLSPVFLLLALAIKIDSPGPILYRSRRVGEGGRFFAFLKFRSMVRDAEARRGEVAHLNEVDGPVFKISRDPRITRVGAFLRRTSLDELPQLWNILNGDMSVVGPRPPIPGEVRHYEPWQLNRLGVRPGLTCLWQVSGRSEVGFDEWMRMDMEYIERRSLGLDLSIILRTVPAVLGGKGAY